jgi:hypothetical protein
MYRAFQTSEFTVAQVSLPFLRVLGGILNLLATALDVFARAGSSCAREPTA